jgi:hypothetical protein
MLVAEARRKSRSNFCPAIMVGGWAGVRRLYLYFRCGTSPISRYLVWRRQAAEEISCCRTADGGLIVDRLAGQANPPKKKYRAPFDLHVRWALGSAPSLLIIDRTSKPSPFGLLFSSVPSPSNPSTIPPRPFVYFVFHQHNDAGSSSQPIFRASRHSLALPRPGHNHFD